MYNRINQTRQWIDDHAIILAAISSILLTIIGVWLIVVINRFDHNPQWWVQADALVWDDPEIVLRAERLENAISTQITQIRDPDQPLWSVAVKPEQANAWLAARLMQTVATHLGEQPKFGRFDKVRMGIEDDRLIIGARWSGESGAMILWSKLEPWINADGELWLKVDSAYVGQAKVATALVGFFEPSVERSKIRVGLAAIRLGDGRVVRLKDVRISGGQIELVMETVVDTNP